MLPLDPGPHRLLGQHRVDGDVLADVAEELERRPSAAVQSRLSTSRACVGPGVEVEEPAELGLDGGRRWRRAAPVEQVALLGAAAGIADHAGGAAGQGDRAVAGVLEAAQQQERLEVADVEAVGRRVEAAVERDRPLAPAGAASAARSVRVVDQAAGVEVVEQRQATRHGRRTRVDTVGRRSDAVVVPPIRGAHR